MKNYGVILSPLTHKDWFVSGKMKIKGEVPDWSFYFPSYEMQVGVYFGTQACVTFSNLNVLETILNYQIANNDISASAYKFLKDNGYFDANDKVNFSDRFIAILSGTTRAGNNQRNVGNAIRKYGLIPEKMLQYPRKQRQPVFTWDDYYNKDKITEAMYDLGQEFKKHFNMYYKAVWQGEFSDYIKISPMVSFIYTGCTGKENCSGTSNHAVMAYTEPDDDFPFFDSYECDGDYIRRLGKDYQFDYPSFVWFIEDLNNNSNNMENELLIEKSQEKPILIQDVEGNGEVSVLFQGKKLVGSKEDVILTYLILKGEGTGVTSDIYDSFEIKNIK